uniref:Uncharacterized protein n=1 Tax=Cacopsylla melanoneura TaxID=428564 RepID=A0A8D8QPP5_9HEMI
MNDEWPEETWCYSYSIHKAFYIHNFVHTYIYTKHEYLHTYLLVFRYVRYTYTYPTIYLIMNTWRYYTYLLVFMYGRYTYTYTYPRIYLIYLYRVIQVVCIKGIRLWFGSH